LPSDANCCLITNARRSEQTFLAVPLIFGKQKCSFVTLRACFEQKLLVIFVSPRKRTKRDSILRFSKSFSLEYSTCEINNSSVSSFLDLANRFDSLSQIGALIKHISKFQNVTFGEIVYLLMLGSTGSCVSPNFKTNDIFSLMAEIVKLDIGSGSHISYEEIMMHSHSSPGIGFKYFIVITDTFRQRFATCDGTQAQGLSTTYQTYLQPFDLGSWILILCTSFLLVPLMLLMLMIQKFAKQVDLIPDLVFRIYRTTIFLLLEIPPCISENLSQLYLHKGKFQFLFGPFLLGIVVLVNYYKELFTARILAPPGSTHVYTEMSQLENFAIHMPGYHYQVFLSGNVTQNVEYFDAMLCHCFEIGEIPTYY